MSIYTHFKMNEEEQPLMQKKKDPEDTEYGKEPGTLWEKSHIQYK